MLQDNYDTLTKPAMEKSKAGMAGPC